MNHFIDNVLSISVTFERNCHRYGSNSRCQILKRNFLNFKLFKFFHCFKSFVTKTVKRKCIQVMSSCVCPSGFLDFSLCLDLTVKMLICFTLLNPYPLCFMRISKVTNYCLIFKRREFLLKGIRK